jgi:hypothetical protein
VSEDWGGWNPDAPQRQQALAAMTPLQRLEWLEQTLVLLGTERLAKIRAKRQAEAEARWFGTAPT